jgi:hypothetical protein
LELVEIRGIGVAARMGGEQEGENNRKAAGEKHVYIKQKGRAGR